jgi:hypothetical protein
MPSPQPFDRHVQNGNIVTAFKLDHAPESMQSSNEPSVTAAPFLRLPVELRRAIYSSILPYVTFVPQSETVTPSLVGYKMRRNCDTLDMRLRNLF